MREIRLSGSEGGGTGNSTGPPYPYPDEDSRGRERAMPAMLLPLGALPGLPRPF